MAKGLQRECLDNIESNRRMDLIFYNRLLWCYMLIDLKVDKLTHQYMGQMQRYINYSDRYEKAEMIDMSLILYKLTFYTVNRHIVPLA